MPPLETLDLGRWTALWSRLGARGDGLAIFTRLAAAYAEPARAYHTAEHIQDCLAHLDLFRQTAQRPDEAEAAIWFHDAVYLPGHPENEERSADLARTALAHAGVPPNMVKRVGNMILATRHQAAVEDRDAALVCDIDLSVLGRSPNLFDRFEQQIRQEYASLSESAYRNGRSQVLEKFLERPAIYQTTPFRERYEAQARANLARTLKKLRS